MNVFTYHVPSRSFLPSEALKLANWQLNTHSILAGDGWGSSLYSAGTVLGDNSNVFLSVIMGAFIAGIVIGAAAASDDEDNLSKTAEEETEQNSDSIIIINNNNNNYENTGRFLERDIKQDIYSAKEVTIFLNEYQKLGTFGSQAAKDEVTLKFLRGDYANSADLIPTEKDVAFGGPAAVLDVEPVSNWNYIGNFALGALALTAAGGLSFGAGLWVAGGAVASYTAAAVGMAATATLATAVNAAPLINELSHHDDYGYHGDSPPSYEEAISLDDIVNPPGNAPAIADEL